MDVVGLRISWCAGILDVVVDSGKHGLYILDCLAVVGEEEGLVVVGFGFRCNGV
jgi:hypothetical protein